MIYIRHTHTHQKRKKSDKVVSLEVHTSFTTLKMSFSLFLPLLGHCCKPSVHPCHWMESSHITRPKKIACHKKKLRRFQRGKKQLSSTLNLNNTKKLYLSVYPPSSTTYLLPPIIQKTGLGWFRKGIEENVVHSRLRWN